MLWIPSSRFQAVAQVRTIFIAIRIHASNHKSTSCPVCPVKNAIGHQLQLIPAWLLTLSAFTISVSVPGPVVQSLIRKPFVAIRSDTGCGS